jgi:hypothetical protein
VKPEGDDYVVLCTERNHTAKLYLPSSLFQVKAGDEWERKDGVSVTPEDIQIMSSTPKAAGLPKNPPGKAENTTYVEETNGWALFPDQRGENVAPTLDKLVPEAMKVSGIELSERLQERQKEQVREVIKAIEPLGIQISPYIHTAGTGSMYVSAVVDGWKVELRWGDHPGRRWLDDVTIDLSTDPKEAVEQVRSWITRKRKQAETMKAEQEARAARMARLHSTWDALNTEQQAQVIRRSGGKVGKNGPTWAQGEWKGERFYKNLEKLVPEAAAIKS